MNSRARLILLLPFARPFCPVYFHAVESVVKDIHIYRQFIFQRQNSLPPSNKKKNEKKNAPSDFQQANSHNPCCCVCIVAPERIISRARNIYWPRSWETCQFLVNNLLHFMHTCWRLIHKADAFVIFHYLYTKFLFQFFIIINKNNCA